MMPALRPFDFAAFSASTMRWSVLRERRQLDGFARLVLCAVRLQPVLLVVRPAFKEFQLPLDRLRGAVAHWEAVFGVGNARRGDLFETHRAPFFEHGQRGVQRARHDRGIEAGAIERFLAGRVPVDVDRFRRPALSDNRGDLVFLLGVDEHERFAAEAIEVLLEDTAGHERCDAGVKRVAAFQQDAEGGSGRERMTGGHATGRSHHRGPQGRSRGLPILDRHLPGSGAAKERNDARPRRAGFFSWPIAATSRWWPS